MNRRENARVREREREREGGGEGGCLRYTKLDTNNEKGKKKVGVKDFDVIGNCSVHF